MTVYKPQHEDWHDTLPGECQCEPAWADRGMVDDRCYYHRMLDVVEELRYQGWLVAPVVKIGSLEAAIERSLQLVLADDQRVKDFIAAKEWDETPKIETERTWRWWKR